MGLLVIGYGNELRGDDGLGPKLARAIEQRQLPGVQVQTRHQLTPELAEPISQATAVVFIDAAVSGSSAVEVTPLSPERSTAGLGHATGPSALLSIARQLYGRCPPSWWIKVPAFQLGFGEELSAEAEAAMADGLEAFRKLWMDQRPDLR